MHTYDEDKAAHLDSVIDEYIEDKSGDNESAVKDILADLMHLCERDGIDFDSCVSSAHMTFEGEVMDLNAGAPSLDQTSSGSAPSMG